MRWGIRRTAGREGRIGYILIMQSCEKRSFFKKQSGQTLLATYNRRKIQDHYDNRQQTLYYAQSMFFSWDIEDERSRTKDKNRRRKREPVFLNPSWSSKDVLAWFMLLDTCLSWEVGCRHLLKNKLIPVGTRLSAVSEQNSDVWLIPSSSFNSINWISKDLNRAPD